MIAHLTPAGAIHAVLAMLCIVVGAVQLLRPKGDARHRAMGYAYVYAMLVADGTAMLVYRFTGQFNAFHVGAIVNFILIVLAMVPLLQNPAAGQLEAPPLLSYHLVLCGPDRGGGDGADRADGAADT